jgi:putative ABC transport system permease protein
MLTIALQTLRQRWALFAGAFVALALGVGLIASTTTVLIASTRPTQPPGALDDVPSLMAVTASIAGFVAVFVVASTFAFTVAQRRQEIALLRLVGATPAQLRRMLLGEALSLGAVAALAGCALSLPGSRLLTSMLIRSGLAPAWFQAPPNAAALLLAFGLGLAVALLGVLLASRRAGTVRAVEALRDAW